MLTIISKRYHENILKGEDVTKAFCTFGKKEGDNLVSKNVPIKEAQYIRLKINNKKHWFLIEDFDIR